MFSLHIDTARTWRGGQNQVLLTVNGLREIGHRAALVAHPDGELRRRAAEGLELIPLAPRREMDLSAAWRLSRVVKRLQPDVIHAHDAHGVAMASLALSLGGDRAPSGPALVASRRVDFHLQQEFVLAVEASPGGLLHRRVGSDPADAGRRRRAAGADGDRARRHRRRPRARGAAGQRARGVLAAAQAPVVGNVAALVPHKGQRHLIEAAHLVVQQIPDARFVILGEGELREHARASGPRVPPREARAAARVSHRRPRVHQGLRSVRHELGHRRARHVAARRDGLLAGRSWPRGRRHSRGRRRRRDGLLVPPRDHAAMAQAIVRCSTDDELRRRMGEAGFARVRERFTVERMVAETAAVYARVAGRPHAADTASPPARG